MSGLLIHKISIERELTRIFEHLAPEAMKMLQSLEWSANQPQNTAVIEGGDVFGDAVGADAENNEEYKASEARRFVGKEMGLISDQFGDAVADQGTHGAAETATPDEEGGFGFANVIKRLT